MRPVHGDKEALLHAQLRDAFNRGLQNHNFFVWIRVRPSGRADRFQNLDRLVGKTETWLHGLAPDELDPKNLPKLSLRDEAAEVQVTAIPRKREVRGHRAAEIVGNPAPVLVGWE